MSTSASSRPKSVTLLMLGVLSIAGFNLVRFVQTLRLWQFLVALPMDHPYYLASSGLIWGIVGAALAWGLWRGHFWALRSFSIFALAYSLYYWIDRLWMSAEAGQANIAFALGLNGFLILMAVWLSSRPAVRAYFGEKHE